MVSIKLVIVVSIKFVGYQRLIFIMCMYVYISNKIYHVIEHPYIYVYIYISHKIYHIIEYPFPSPSS